MFQYALTKPLGVNPLLLRLQIPDFLVNNYGRLKGIHMGNKFFP